MSSTLPMDAALENCTLFRNIHAAIVKEILTQAKDKRYNKGDILIEKGAVPDALFIIREGKASIYNEDVLLAELGPLSIMGESFLADASATATIVAGDGLRTIEINRDLFYEMSLKHPQLVFNIFQINFLRLRAANESALREARHREEKLEQLVTTLA